MLQIYGLSLNTQDLGKKPSAVPVFIGVGVGVGVGIGVGVGAGAEREIIEEKRWLECGYSNR